MAINWKRLLPKRLRKRTAREQIFDRKQKYAKRDLEVKRIDSATRENLLQKKREVIEKSLVPWKPEELNFYQNNKGELYLTRKEAGSTTLEVWRFTVQGLRKNAVCELYPMKDRIYIQTTTKTNILKDHFTGEPLPESKYRAFFRIFLDEALRLAREKGLKKIEIQTSHKPYQRYLMEHFGFEPSSSYPEIRTGEQIDFELNL